MTGSSVNFQPIKSAMKAVNHADRTVPPKYLLSEEHSQGAFCIYGKDNNISDVLENKLSLASRQAKREKNFSPLWEGVINLPRPKIDENFNAAAYKKECIASLQKWVNEYPKMTGHSILRIDLHLDEGLILENGEIQLNAHAHVMIDRTNELGRVKKLSPKVLREIQTMTAEATGLPRGESSFKTGASHLSPQDFKQVAEKIRLEKKSEILKLKEQYDLDREALKASGNATQKAYQDLKITYDALVKTYNEMATKANATIHKLKEEKAEMKKEIQVLTDRDAERELHFSQMAKEFAEHKANGGNVFDFDAGPTLDEQKRAQEALKTRFEASSEADTLDIEHGRVVGAVSGLAVLHIGQGRHVFFKLPAGSPLPEVGKHLTEQQREGISR
jgi:hypothetical protein